MPRLTYCSRYAIMCAPVSVLFHYYNDYYSVCTLVQDPQREDKSVDSVSLQSVRWWLNSFCMADMSSCFTCHQYAKTILFITLSKIDLVNKLMNLIAFFALIYDFILILCKQYDYVKILRIIFCMIITPSVIASIVAKPNNMFPQFLKFKTGSKGLPLIINMPHA